MTTEAAVESTRHATEKKEMKVGAKRYEARSRGCSSPDTLVFLTPAQTIEPTTAWTAASSPVEAPGTRFYT